MQWIARDNLDQYDTVDDLDLMLDVMLKPELTEFQYLVTGDDWTVQLK